MKIRELRIKLMLFFYLNLFDTEDEKSKFEQIYYTYSKLMKYIANNILHDDFLAEDAVHNAFIKLTKHLHSIEDVSSHKTKCFIIIVIESVSKDMYMKRKREATVNINNYEYELMTEDIHLENYNLEKIVDVIEKLPNIYKEIIFLKFIHEYNDTEISKLLDIKRATVRKRVERAKIKLAKLLQEEVK